MKEWSYLNSAVQILGYYKGQEPFASFLKKYFASRKKYGSRDRKQISHLCYCFFRLGKTELPLSLEDKILTGLFFCSDRPNEILNALKPEWSNDTPHPLPEKCSKLSIPYSMLNVFPWKDELSEGIEHEKFVSSFFIQPDLFLRLRPGKENIVIQKLQKAGIAFTHCSENSIALPNAIRVDEIVELNREAVIQDLSSQRTGDLLVSIVREKLSKNFRVWDCCTASGGKAIMAVDLLGKIELTVSDIRESIIHNLEKRFAEAGIRNYDSFVTDLSLASPTIHHEPFDLIIADVPCSGSGTWGRTPEQLFYFDEKEIGRYSSLQKKIVSNAVPFLKPGGFILYITCSVFKKENEENIDYLLKRFPLFVKSMGIINGYNKKADTMFVALLQKSL